MLKRLVTVFTALVLVAVGYVIGLNARVAPAEAMQGTGTRYFPETGHTVKGRFLQYWSEHGGLTQQGFPLTEEFVEVSELNGREYVVQYFERAVFEMHPENYPPNDVLLSQLGTFQLRHRYPNGVPQQSTPQPSPTPKPLVGWMEVSDYASFALPKGGGLRVVGLAKNASNDYFGQMQITVTLKSAVGDTVAEATAFGPSLMAPGDVWPFDVTFAHKNPAFESVGFLFLPELPTDLDMRRYYRSFDVSDTQILPANEITGAGVLVRGNIKNVGDARTFPPNIYVAVFDASGKLIDVTQTLPATREMAPGDMASFDAQMTVKRASRVRIEAYAYKN